MGEGGRKTSLVAPGEDRVTALVGEINSEPCFLSLLSVTPLTKATGSGDGLSGVFRCSLFFSFFFFSGNTTTLELNQNKMAAGGFLCEDAHGVSCCLFSNGYTNGTALHWSHDCTAVLRGLAGCPPHPPLAAGGAGASPSVHWTWSGSFSKSKQLEDQELPVTFQSCWIYNNTAIPQKPQHRVPGDKASAAVLFSKAPGRRGRRN